MSDDDDRVGYGRPPKSGRIKKGERRNPTGRPPENQHVALPMQVTRDFVMISEMMVELPTQKGVKKMTLRQGIIWNTAIQALKGKPTALKLWDKWMTATLNDRSTIDMQIGVVKALKGMAQDPHCSDEVDPEMLGDMIKRIKKPF